jgi:hypothetical protein
MRSPPIFGYPSLGEEIGSQRGHVHVFPRQILSGSKRGQRTIVPLAIIAQDRLRPSARMHHAAVRVPLADPVERQCIAGAKTLTCPFCKGPLAPPIRATKCARASTPLASGQGWPDRHEPSISRAAIPERRTFAPSLHQIGPSPSHTATGVQTNRVPAATTTASAFICPGITAAVPASATTSVATRSNLTMTLLFHRNPRPLFGNYLPEAAPGATGGKALRLPAHCPRR